jgi:hypothetical protein
MGAAQLLKTGQQSQYGFTRRALAIRRVHGTCPQKSPAIRPCFGKRTSSHCNSPTT